jgi:putative effector of murein hydrolase LrgA (UPF0299 family)
MNILLDIWNTINDQLNWFLILGIIALGEITKRLWTSPVPPSFWKVLIVTLPFTVGYVYLQGADITQSSISYLLAYWLYPFIVKFILDKFKRREYSTSAKSSFHVGDRPDDR